MNKKNIMFFILDELRADALGFMGNEAISTPHYDELADEGISFDNSFCQNPVCVPSRCSFNTGIYPHAKGHRTIHYFLEHGDPSMMKSMKKNGYHVYLMGKSHYFDRKDAKEMEETCNYEYIGFEPDRNHIHMNRNVCEEEIKADPRFYSFSSQIPNGEGVQGRQDDLVVERTLEMIRNHELEEPFCLYISLNLPHPPYEVEEPWFSSVDRDKICIRTKNIEDLKDKPSILYRIRENQNLYGMRPEDYINIRGIYYGMVEKTDDQLGRIIDALKENGYYDDTHILSFADHGDYACDYGIVEKNQNTFEDCLTHIPFIFKPAKGIDYVSRRCNEMVELNDIPLTVSQLLGYSLDYTQQGESLLPLLKEDQQIHEYVLSCGGRVKGETQAMEGWTSITSVYYPRLEAQCHMPDHTKAYMVRDKKYKYVYRLYEKDEFYDLEADPYEEENAIDIKEYEFQIEKMKNWLLKKLVETTDFVPMYTKIDGRHYGEE